MEFKKKIKIISLKDNIILRTAEKRDLELLRLWKNDNRSCFFYKDIITPEQQLEWFKSYLKRVNDYIIIITFKQKSMGCLGFRLLENNGIDIYNAILGKKEFGGKGIMGRSLKLLCSYIINNFHKEISLKVLSDNYNAINWYKKNGFIELYNEENYTFMKLDTVNFNHFEYNQKIID
jgi:RimJ/RimL family protein N-acetyltransferase